MNPPATVPTVTRPETTAPLPLGTRLLIGSFTASGVLHLVRPRIFEPLIPPVLGPPTPWVIGSGLVELGCAAGLVTRQRWAPKATAAVLLSVWVGNWWMAIRATRKHGLTPMTAATWARVPLQVPMIRAALTSPTKT